VIENNWLSSTTINKNNICIKSKVNTQHILSDKDFAHVYSNTFRFRSCKHFFSLLGGVFGVIVLLEYHSFFLFYKFPLCKSTHLLISCNTTHCPSSLLSCSDIQLHELSCIPKPSMNRHHPSLLVELFCQTDPLLAFSSTMVDHLTQSG